MRTRLAFALQPSRLLSPRPAVSPRHLLIRAAAPVARYSSQAPAAAATAATATTPAASNNTSIDPQGRTIQEYTPEEYRKYNRIAFGMEGMHSELRDMFLSLQSSIERMIEPVDKRIVDNFIKRGITFCEELEAHHNREEAFLFPKLAVRMPEFGEESVLVDQHHRVHTGASAWEKYLHECQFGVKKFEVAKSKEMMGTFAETLMEHLDLEVYALRPDRIRAHWTLEEFRKIP